MIETALEAGLGTITLAAPERANALGPADIDAISEALEHLSGEPQLTCVLLRAKGEIFSAGGRLEALANASPDAIQKAASVALMRLYNAFLECPAPTLCALNGAAAGGGLGLVLMADIIIAKSTAQMIVPFARLGLVPDSGLSKTLTEALGPARARLLFLSAGSIDAHTALATGLVSVVSEPADFEACIQNHIDTLKQSAPGLARAVRRLTASPPDFEAALAREAKAQAQRFATADTQVRIQRAIKPKAPRT